jgi:hypothetical protein
MLLSAAEPLSGVTMQQSSGVAAPSLPAQSSSLDLVVLDDEELSKVVGALAFGPGSTWSDLSAGPGSNW